MSSFKAWMPSKMTISSFLSLSDLEGSSTRIWRANSYFGTSILSPRASLVKCSLRRSMSMHLGLSKSMSPSLVRGAVAGSTVRK